MKKGSILLFMLFLSLLSLVVYEVTHVFGSAKLYSVSLPVQNKKINAGIDKIEVRKMKFKELIDINGWAYINNIDATQQKVYVALISGESQYVYSAEKVFRADLPDALNDKQNKIENAGLESMINMSEIKTGSYQIGFYIENESQKELTLTDMLVEKKNNKVELVEKTNNKIDMKLDEAKNKIQANIEEVVNEKGYVKIKGWAFLSDITDETNEIYVVLKNQENNQMIFFDTNPQIRKDVTTYFGGETNRDSSGFISKIGIDKLENKKYQLGIYVKNQTATGIYWSKESIGE